MQALREEAEDPEGRWSPWDFTHTRGVPPEGARQEEWPNGIENGVVDFVVTPGYVVNGSALAPQQVFTMPPQASMPTDSEADMPQARPDEVSSDGPPPNAHELRESSTPITDGEPESGDPVEHQSHGIMP